MTTLVALVETHLGLVPMEANPQDLFHPPALPPPFPYLLRSDRFKTFRSSRTQGLDSLKSWQDGIHQADTNSPRDELVGTGHGSPEAKAAQSSSSAAGLTSWKQRSRTRRTRVRMSRPGHQRTQEASCLHGRKGGCFVDSRASSSSTSTTPFVPSSRQVASTPESRTSSFHSFKYPKILDKRTWPQLDDTKGEPAPPFIPPSLNRKSDTPPRKNKQRTLQKQRGCAHPLPHPPAAPSSEYFVRKQFLCALGLVRAPVMQGHGACHAT